MFKLEIKTGGAAFCDPHTGKENECCERREIARILKEIRDDILVYGKTSGNIMDLNGNKVGSWSR